MSLLEARRSLPRDFPIFLMAHRLKLQDHEYLEHLGAWVNQAVQATKGSPKNPKPKYKKFNQFYDSVDSFNDVLGVKREEVRSVRSSGSRLADMNMLLNKENADKEEKRLVNRRGRRDIALMNLLMNKQGGE